ncbi:helix-turn-helix domain-containing protein [Streptomyces sp. NBC_01477]|uniref:helix-turn-helix domain-containing protein n=1 Tax=Streptomyces sp. NBC_01477 TaxID=2976015 RepID=UPI002E3309B3|nr:helix-turn-helix transcriptional regulator [Streptomyces sp. NBC_01477]
MTDTKEPVPPTQAERFGQFAMAAAREAGYDVDSPRGGGRKAIAERSGMGQTAVGRMLAGRAIPDPKFFPGLASALDIDLRTLLIRSGLAPEKMLPVIAPPPSRSKPTLDQLAREVGIYSERGTQLFKDLVNGILAQEPKESGKNPGSGAA